MTGHNEASQQGPADTEEAKRERLPRVVAAYAKSIRFLNEQGQWPVDSGFAGVLERAAVALSATPEGDTAKIADLKRQLAGEREHSKALQAQVDAIMRPANARAMKAMNRALSAIQQAAPSPHSELGYAANELQGAIDAHLPEAPQPAAYYAAKNPLGGSARVFEVMAERIRAGEDYDAVLADYDLHRRSSARAVAEKCAEIAAHAYDDAGPSQKEWVGAAIHIAREIRAYRDTHGAPLPATQRSEPVAWRWKWKHHGDWRHTGAKPREGDAIDVEPLYAAPLSETPAGGTAKPTGSWRPFKALEKSAHWTVIDENHETLFTCWRGEIDARRICELHALHKSTASPSGTAKVPEEAIRLLRWWLRTHGDEDGIPKPVEEATKAFLAAEPSPNSKEKQSLLRKIFDTPSPDGNEEKGKRANQSKLQN